MRETAFPGIAVGFFDGVHLGHREILRGVSAALTFRNHPLTVLAPARAPRLIMPVSARVEAIRACGVDEVTVLDFTRELADLPPEAFAETYLKRHGRVRCGDNWRFGRNGAGTADVLRKAGIAVEIAPYATYAGARISSSRIRAALGRGEIEEANAMLGRRYEIRGRIAVGKGVGRQFGFPTINVRPSDFESPDTALALPLGVYEVVLNGVRGIANYGRAPTLGDRAWPEPVLEVHLLDSFASPVPDGPPSSAGCPPPTSVQIVRFIRPERKFASVEELRHQIAADCAKIQA